MMKGISAGRFLLISLNTAAALALILALLSSYISPLVFWELALFGLAFPYIVFINLIFLSIWIFKKSPWVLVSLIPIIAAIPDMRNTIRFGWKEDGLPVKESSIKILSFNVRLFDLYNWTNNRNTRTAIHELMAREKPDVLCIQEFFSSESRDFENIQSLRRLLTEAIGKEFDYHLKVHKTLNKDDIFGTITFTHLKMAEKEEMVFDSSSNNGFLRTDVEWNGDTLRIFNVHLQSIRFRKEDYTFIEHFGEKPEEEELNGILKLVSRLKKAYIRRSGQTETLSGEISKTPHPIVLCGDFNDSPTSYTFHRIHSSLTDAFQHGGTGFGKTYVGSFPSFRIDYIFHSDQLGSQQFRTIKEQWSDHFPVTAIIFKK